MTIPASLVARIRGTACQHGVFHLPTGQVIDEYFDEYLLASDPVLLRDVAVEMARFVPPGTEALVGLELGGIPLAVAVSATSRVPAAFLRRERKSYGTCRQIEGYPVEGRRVVLIDDVVRSGSQVLRAAAVLRQLGVRVAIAICVLDRDLGGRERLAEDEIVLRSLLTTADLGARSLVRRSEELTEPLESAS